MRERIVLTGDLREVTPHSAWNLQERPLQSCNHQEGWPRANFQSLTLTGSKPISDNPASFLEPKWRNWQTHWFQVPAPVRVSGFNSRLRHHTP